MKYGMLKFLLRKRLFTWHLSNTKVFKSPTEILKIDVWSYNQRLEVWQEMRGELYRCSLNEPQKVLTPASFLNLVILHSDSDNITTDGWQHLGSRLSPRSPKTVNSKRHSCCFSIFVWQEKAAASISLLYYAWIWPFFIY